MLKWWGFTALSFSRNRDPDLELARQLWSRQHFQIVTTDLSDHRPLTQRAPGPGGVRDNQISSRFYLGPSGLKYLQTGLKLKMAESNRACKYFYYCVTAPHSMDSQALLCSLRFWFTRSLRSLSPSDLKVIFTPGPGSNILSLSLSPRLLIGSSLAIVWLSVLIGIGIWFHNVQSQF